MPRRRRKSRLRKRDFMVFSGEQTSSILKTNKDFGMSRRRGLLAKAKRTIRRAAHAVASVFGAAFYRHICLGPVGMECPLQDEEE